MADPCSSFPREMELRGSRAMSSLILEIREAEGEVGLGHFVAGALLAIFGYYAHEICTLRPIEALLDRHKSQTIEVGRPPDDDPVGRLQ